MKKLDNLDTTINTLQSVQNWEYDTSLTNQLVDTISRYAKIISSQEIVWPWLTRWTKAKYDYFKSLSKLESQFSLKPENFEMSGWNHIWLWIITIENWKRHLRLRTDIFIWIDNNPFWDYIKNYIINFIKSNNIESLSIIWSYWPDYWKWAYQEIPNWLFSGCKLKNIFISSIDVWDFAFSWCNIEELKLVDVENIWRWAFSENPSLKTVKVLDRKNINLDFSDIFDWSPKIEYVDHF